MFRVTQFMQELAAPDAARRRARDAAAGPVVIWNLIRRCNLTCKHCYSISADIDFPGELSTAEVFAVMDDLKALRRAGADPLRRRAAAAARHLRRSRAREGDGLLRRPVHQRHADRRADGRPHRRRSASTTSASASTASRATHDRFRRKAGAFDAVARRRSACCRDAGIKVGLRFTLTAGQRARPAGAARADGATRASTSSTSRT